MIIHNVEQGTDEWHALRAGKPTASEASKLLTTKGEPSKQVAEYAIQLAADLYAGEPLDRWEGNQWTDRGHEMEDRARAYYENTFPDREVEQVGFITDDAGRAGASPDSLVRCPSAGGGLLEIKCLKASRHVAMLVFYARNARVKSDYIMQPQMQMQVAEEYGNFCDLLFYHPELPPLLVRHKPEEVLQVNLKLAIASCIDERDRIIEILNNA